MMFCNGAASLLSNFRKDHKSKNGCIQKVLLGSFREAMVERLNEQSWREVMEILFAITFFRQDFSFTFLAMVTALLLIKALHWLAQKRVEYIKTTPPVPWLSHVRIISFMGFLLLPDSVFLYSSMKHWIKTWQASVSLFFSYEYMILATSQQQRVQFLQNIFSMSMTCLWRDNGRRNQSSHFTRNLLETCFTCLCICASFS